jgi:predicted nucleic acid-binding protein
MTISIDSNIIVALWQRNDPASGIAASTLERARKRGGLVVSGPVYSELMGDPSRTETGLDDFLGDTGILIDWTLDELVWREAGRAYRGYAQRRRSSGGNPPRHILTDFLIGAQAVVRRYTLLTFDQRLYAAAFPALEMMSN